MYDLIIIGAGPAGLSAAIYAQRAMLNTLVIEKSSVSGGQIVYSSAVENYMGFASIEGYALGEAFRAHAEKFGAQFMEAEIKGMIDHGAYKEINVSGNVLLKTKAVIIATGAVSKKLGIQGEEKLTGDGVSYCAACDGAFFAGKTVSVIGGGDTAIDDAIYLARICRQVILIHRRSELRASKSIQQALFRLPNVSVMWDTVVKEIIGSGYVEGVMTKNITTGATEKISLDGVFIAVGTTPETAFLADIVALDDEGYIIAGESGKTNVSGIFAAGDVRTKRLRQVITAAADGANCVCSLEEYIGKEY